MAINIELKARANDPDRQRQIARELAGSVGELLIQTDTFFVTPNGRLKLREQSGRAAGEMIYYERTDDTGPTQCTYFRQPIDDVEGAKAMFAAALGVRGVVRKKRRLFMVSDTRVHFDEVRDLGAFIELEVVLQPGVSSAEAMAAANDLMKQLNIRGEDLVREAYIDLLEAGE